MKTVVDVTDKGGLVSIDHDEPDKAIPGGETPQRTVWRSGDPEQLDKLAPTFEANGIAKGDVSAMRDRINEDRKQRKS